MKGIIMAFVLLYAGATLLQAQTEVLDVEPADTTAGKFGPNRAHFLHAFMSIGAITGQQQAGARIRIPASNVFEVGLRYKHKISEVLSLGVDLSFTTMTYNFQQESGKVIIDTTRYDREWLAVDLIDPGLFVRLNFGQRGNSIGNFWDVGGSIPLKVGAAHVVQFENNNGEQVQISTTRLSYLSTWQWYAYTRLGFGRFVLYGRYRFGPVFNDKVTYPALPPITVGMQLGFH